MPNEKVTISHAAPPKKEAPTVVGRRRKTETKMQTYSESTNAATFPFWRDGFYHELIERIGLVCLVARSKGARQALFEVAFTEAEGENLANGGLFARRLGLPGPKHADYQGIRPLTRSNASVPIWIDSDGTLELNQEKIADRNRAEGAMTRECGDRL